MNFYLSYDDFNKLKFISSNSSNEQADVMYFKEDKNGYSFSSLEVFDKDRDELNSNGSWFVKYNSNVFLSKILYEVMHSQDSEGVVVRLYTHPKKISIDGGAIPSKVDKQHIKE